MRNVIFINSHPIQYFAPLYKFMNEQGTPITAWYCSDASIKGGHDKGFGVKVKWDVPLLEGYKYRFFKNYSWKPSHSKGFFGLMNLGMIRELFRIPKSIIIVHGWNYFSHVFILLFGRLRGHTMCLRCETPQNQEILKTGFKQLLKRAGLKHILFPCVNYFLYIGSQNQLFYEKYRLPDSRLIFCPYSVDDNRFRAEWQRLTPHRAIIKRKLGIGPKDKVILYSGKYITKKRPLDLLNAFVALNKPDCWLIMVGEGELRKEMEILIREKNANNVVLTGFVNQSAISEYYAISDVFVMCSEIGETWGLSVNEAMNFNLPVIISDLTGCSQDLVNEGINGYIFKTGDINELTTKLKHVLVDNKLSGAQNSQNILKKFSYSVIHANLTRVLG